MLISDQALEKKSAVENYNFASESFADFLLSGGNFDLSAQEAIRLYEKCSPFAMVVNKRAQAFSGIKPRVKSRKTNEFIDDHPVLDLFKNPNLDVSQIELMRSLASLFDITGNVFLLATGQQNKQPIELFVEYPQCITLDKSASTIFAGAASSLTLNTESSLVKFKPKEIVMGGIRTLRYYNDDMREIWQIRNFNPNAGEKGLWGLSTARPLWSEIEQYISGNDNNLSFLERGARPSMAWVNASGQELTADQWTRMQQEAQKYAGSNNAGATPVLDGVDIKTFNVSNSDMQFSELQKSMLSRIANMYGVPLAMLLDTAMTLNNLETSELQFYDNAVLPLATMIFSELTRFLMPRYENSEDLYITYNENDIEALQVRALEKAKKRKDIRVNTTNEIREILGDDESDQEGANDIYQESSLVKLGEEKSESVEPVMDNEDDEPKFFALMRELKTSDGSRKYSDEDIKSLWAEYGNKQF